MSTWLDSAVFYQIYPQSFCDSNGDGIGDIPGIMKKLDYIQRLGCSAIWINPMYESPFQDAGYDVSDYRTIAPRYGTNADLRALFDEVHRRGMHVLLDLVPGHTSVEHPWFRESMKGRPNPYTKRYIWTDHTTQSFPLLGQSRRGGENIRSFILGIGERDGLCATNYYSCQPCLNYGFEEITDTYQSAADSPEAAATREDFIDIMRFWLKMGCDGFRMDMAGTLVKNDPEGRGSIRVWQQIRAFLDREFPEAVMISEWGDPACSIEAGFHMDFLLHFGPSHYNDLFRTEEPYFSRRGRGDISAFAETYRRNCERTANKGLICIPSGNHDMSRMARELDAEEMKVAFAFLLSMPGAPFIYYGDEIGMRHIRGLISREGSRSSRAGCRTPMQWDDGLHDGFSDASPEKLYFPIDPDPDHPRVSAQMGDPDSLWSEVHRLIALRGETPELQAAAPVRFLFAEPHAYPFVYKREGEKREILVALNPSGDPASCPLEGIALGQCIYSHHGQAAYDGAVLRVPPASASFFVLE
ncbi:MAG: DUF3459 domain-containing protein [Oscillospiraceae bacterium]|nr:DUF3459 domain-containing protein [Oscillospiraceae bacterium]